MKRLTILLAVGIVFLFIVLPAAKHYLTPRDDTVHDAPTARIESGGIIVRGPNNTLATIAQQIKDPAVFSYDAERKLAVCKGNIVVEGDLMIGAPDAEGLAETLEFNSTICGDCMLIVRPGGSLEVHNAEIATVKRMVSRGLCPMGYGIVGQGRVVMKNARLLYMSGSVSTMFTGTEASGELDRIVAQGGETNAFSYDGIDGSRITIRNCNFMTSATSAAWAGFTLNHPLTVYDTTFMAEETDLRVEEGADLILVDCSFRPDRMKFTGRRAQVDIRWTRTYRVVDASGKPIAGAKVKAESMQGAAHAYSADASTDENGLATLVLRDYIAERGRQTRDDGTNNSAPYHITAGHAGLTSAVYTEELRPVVDKSVAAELVVK